MKEVSCPKPWPCKDMLEMSQPEVQAELKNNGTIVIATGSFEQHGPHLPMGTDYYAVQAIARRVAAGLDAMLAPFPALGVAHFHMGIAGSITLSNQTFSAVFSDLCESLIKHGAKKFVVVNWHEGNTPAIGGVCMDLQLKYPDALFIISQVCYLAQELFNDVSGLTHAGLLEVLPVMGIRPDLVHLEKATNPSDPVRAARMDALRRRREACPIIPDIRMMYKTGWYGDVSKSTPELAEELLDKVSKASARAIRESMEQMEEARKS